MAEAVVAFEGKGLLERGEEVFVKRARGALLDCCDQITALPLVNGLFLGAASRPDDSVDDLRRG